MAKTKSEIQLAENCEMKNELQVLAEVMSFEGGDVKIIVENEEPLFELKSTAIALGQTQIKNGIVYLREERLNKNLKSADIKPFPRNGESYISESQLYDLMLEMKTDKCKIFRKWVVEKVLPTIRRTGGYVANDEMFVDTYLPFADEATKNLFKVTVQVIRQQNEMIAERDKTIVEKDEKIEKQQPFVDFTKKLLKSKENILVREFAKLMQDENVVDFGQNKMFGWLRNQGYLNKQNEPYQKFVTRGIFQVKKVVKDTAFGVKDFSTTVITPKGQAILWNKLIKFRERTATT